MMFISTLCERNFSDHKIVQFIHILNSVLQDFEMNNLLFRILAYCMLNISKYILIFIKDYL